MKETKEKLIHTACLSIDQDIRNGIPTCIYTLQTCLSNTQRSHKKKQIRVIKNKDGDTISDDTEIAKR